MSAVALFCVGVSPVVTHSLKDQAAKTPPGHIPKIEFQWVCFDNLQEIISLIYCICCRCHYSYE